MKIIIKSFKYIFSLILWVIFWIIFTVLSMLLIIINKIIPRKCFDRLSQISCYIITYFLLIFPKVNYLSKEKIKFPVIYVANHVSFFDLFISGCVLSGHPRGFELKSHFKKPIYGWFIKQVGQIPLDISSSSKMRKSFDFAISILNNKKRNIFIMPEGSRTRDGKLKKFYHGAFYLAKKSGYPIIPVIYKNLYHKNNVNSIIINPGKLDIVISDPIYPKDFESEKEMSKYTREIMNNILEEN